MTDSERCCAHIFIAGLLLLHMSKGENIWSVVALAHSTSILHTTAFVTVAFVWYCAG